MAVTSAITAVTSGTTKVWDVISSADADVAGVITHGFTVNGVATAPGMVWAQFTIPRAWLKQWTIGPVTTTVINLAAISATGGGLAGTPQLQVFAMLPHSLLAPHP